VSTIDRAALTDEMLRMWRDISKQEINSWDEDALLDEAQRYGIDISEFCVFFAVDPPDEIYPTALEVWEAVNGGGVRDKQWEHIRFSDGADWETPGILYVGVRDPDSDALIHKSFTADDLRNVYLSMPMDARKHCGRDDVVGNPDACSWEQIMQWAFFGKLVWG
jgi:hypothetical protein